MGKLLKFKPKPKTNLEDEIISQVKAMANETPLNPTVEKGVPDDEPGPRDSLLHVLLPGLGVQRQHPELVGLIADKIDHSQAATLARARAPPTELPDAAGATNDRPGFRVLHQELLQLGVFVVIEVQRAHAIKSGRLDEREHKATLRLWRSPVNSQACRGLCPTTVPPGSPRLGHL